MSWAWQGVLDPQTDPELRLGVRIVGRAARQVENTLPERLRRVLEHAGPRGDQIALGVRLRID